MVVVPRYQNNDLPQQFADALLALPSQVVGQYPELAPYDAPLGNYTGGHILQFYLVVQSEANREWLTSLLDVSPEKVEEIAATTKGLIGPRVLELWEQLKR